MLGVMGLYIAINATFSFRKADTTINPMKPNEASELVVEGFYQVTRNPMYLGLLLMLSGWCFWLGNPVGIPRRGGVRVVYHLFPDQTGRAGAAREIRCGLR